MERYKHMADRNQMQLAPMCLDDLIAPDAEVRALELIVERMGIPTLGFTHSITKQTGRMPYSPVDMFKLYAYSYYNGIRSSRKMERECHRNIELMWLIGELKPDFKTIADFRKDNKDAIQKAFARFSQICCELGLVSREMVAVDGSKFRASNSRAAYYSKKNIVRKLADQEKAAKKYLELLNANDEDETGTPRLSRDEILKKLDQLEQRRKKLDALQEIVQEVGSISETDPDSRLMKCSNKGVDICYNTQTAVEMENHLVVAVDVTNQPTDKEQLHSMAVQAKQALQAENLTVVADKGYYSASQFAACEKDGISPIVSRAHHPNATNPWAYGKELFRYDEEKGGYICPEGHLFLPFKSRASSKHQGFKYYRNKEACDSCKVREKCTPSKVGRTIEDRPHQDIARMVDKRTKENMDLYHKRKDTVEHPFGTVKRALGFSYFLTRGLESVRAESCLHFLAYNIKRVLNILGMQELRAQMVG